MVAVQAERVLDALGDPTRRLVFKRLRKGTRSVRELADGMDVSRPAVSQHLKVLKDAGWITGEVDGPRMCYCARPETLRRFRALARDLEPGNERSES